MDKRQATCAEVLAGLCDYALHGSGLHGSGLEGCTDLEEHFAACPACRQALEAERGRLAPLDALPPVEPPANLAETTSRRVSTVQRKFEAPKRRPLMSVYEAVAAVCLVAVAACILLPALARSRESARRSSSVNNLKQMGLVFKMYANETEGRKFPPMAPYSDICVFDLRTIYPEILSDPAVLINPSSPNSKQFEEQLREALAKSPPDWDTAHHIVAQNYVYTGYAVKDDSEVAEFQEARARGDDDLEIAGKKIYRLREGIERFYITDINNPAASAGVQSEIPVLMENPSSRELGINVLYMDGHVEFVERGLVPATDAFRKAFPLPPLKK